MGRSALSRDTNIATLSTCLGDQSRDKWLQARAVELLARRFNEPARLPHAETGGRVSSLRCKKYVPGYWRSWPSNPPLEIYIISQGIQYLLLPVIIARTEIQLELLE
ncbi:hypothetical protein GQ44DRAFT_832914 [Phaeosphaeriaceae sp. PMI808]|nr:hypothetical protein GQ44DRAFT_832914 [Phaeosphaeriaceae sp. PMI808]